jgi:protein involved in polysaccharide export with SLBB domain
MSLRFVPRFAVAVVIFTVSLRGAPVHAQTRFPTEQSEVETTRQSSGAPAIPIHTPGDTEVLHNERAGTESPNAPSYPTEGPIAPEKYICGEGDIFELNFWGRQNFKLRITVDLEGRTFVPKIGYVDVAGKSLADARAVIKRAVARYYPGLNSDLSLLVPRSFVVHVAGYVGKPGAYVSNSLERVASLIARAGGLTGSKRRIDIERRDHTHDTADLVLYEFTGDTKYNPRLLDGDVVFVPKSVLSVSINGAVSRPGRFELTNSKDLAELVELAGGFKSSATRSLPIRLVHRNQRDHADTMRIPMPKEGQPTPTVALHDEDQVYVPSVAELQRSISIIGPVPGATAADEVTSIRRFEFVQGSTVRTVLEAAGGVGASADLQKAYIRKDNGAVIPVDLDALLIRRNFDADRSVEVGDTIVVPQKRYAVAVEGAVMHPAAYPFNPSFSGEQYVATAGGPRQNARSISSFRLITGDGRTMTLRRDSKISPGDTILVPERTFSPAEVAQLIVGSVGLLVSSFSLVYLITR